MTSFHKELISILLVRLAIMSRDCYTGPNEVHFYSTLLRLRYTIKHFFRLNNSNKCTQVCVNITRSRDLCNIYLKDAVVILQRNVVRRVYWPRVAV